MKSLILLKIKNMAFDSMYYIKILNGNCIFSHPLNFKGFSGSQVNMYNCIGYNIQFYIKLNVIKYKLNFCMHLFSYE